MISFLILYLTIFIKTNNINKTIPNNNFKKDRVKRKVQIETYFDTTIQTETNYITIYQINVTYFLFYNLGLDLHIFSTPELNEDITLLITLYIDKYNDSLGYWTSKEIDVRAYDYYGTGEMFSAYIDDLNLDNFTSDISLTVLNIIVESNNTNNDYYVYFEEMTFNFPEETDTYIPWDMSDYYQTDTYSSYPDTTDNTEISYISGGSKSSGSISTGVIIGIIAGVVAVIGIIVTIIICVLKRKRAKVPPGNPQGQSRQPERQTGQPEGPTDTVGINASLKHLNTKPTETKNLGLTKKRKFILKTIKQAKLEIEIEENKRILDLRKLYFETIRQPELIEDETIYFTANGDNISNDPNALIENKFNGNDKSNVIVVVDVDDKINL